MKQTIDDSKPIFQQIKEQIEDMIINNMLTEDGRVPSTNEFANHYKINPATASKGINQLVDEGIIYKKRGVGMFVTKKAKEIVFQKRKDSFIETYVIPMQIEAEKLNITNKELQAMLTKGGHSSEN